MYASPGLLTVGLCWLLVTLSGHAAASGVTQRKLQTPGTAEEHKRQETPTTNAIDRQPTNLTDQAPSTSSGI